MLKRLLIGSVAALAVVSVAWAIQPGTDGTEKRFQTQGLRSGVLIQKNNTATASSNAATLNAAGSGVITTEALTTLAGSDYTLTLTNNMVAAADLVFATVQYGTATTGSPFVSRITPAAGSVVILVRNGASTDSVLNGTVKIGFFVLKQNANGSD